MNTSRLVVALSGVALLTLATAGAASSSFSEQDKTFVGKVSQGGMYEVALGTLAETKATTQDVRDQGNTEVHDHKLVGAKLKAIMERNGMKFPKALNQEFQARLAKMQATPAARFDAAYLVDMKKIHDGDGAAFAQEAKAGSNPDLRSFAAETYRIVQRHLGEIGASVR